jgi:hypothetical protein
MTDTKADPLRKALEKIIRRALSWHPSENGPSYWEISAELRTMLDATLPPAAPATRDEVATKVRGILSDQEIIGIAADAILARAPQPAAISNSDLMRCGPMDENDWKDQRIQSLEDYIAELKKSTAEPQEKA